MLDTPALYIVATPIGNLEDITLRALTVLKKVSLIAAEDTRQSKKLLRHYGINTPLYSLHAHNEQTHSGKVIAYLQNKASVAYITDAGTPLISDPGAYLVQSARQAGFSIIPIPGPCAAIAALSAAGITDASFYFAGFLPHKQALRRQHLHDLTQLSCTLLFYESPHRIVKMINDTLAVLGNREAFIVRELTKCYETILWGSLAELLFRLQEDVEQQRGEFVVILPGRAVEQDIPTQKIDAILTPLIAALPLKQAVELASELVDVRKNDLYARALAIKNLLKQPKAD